MPLTDAERSVLSNGLAFVQLKKGIDEYQIKADCEVLYIAYVCVHVFAAALKVTPSVLLIEQTPSPNSTLRSRPGLLPKANFQLKITKLTVAVVHLTPLILINGKTLFSICREGGFTSTHQT